MENPQIDYSHKWYVMAAVGMGTLLATIDGSIVNLALPTLSRVFDSTFAVVQWVVLAYLLTQATLTLGFGRLGDMIGKKPIFTSGFAVFTFGSVLAALSPTIGFLIAARVVQALGAAMIFALGFAITTEAFPPSERGKALGINGTTVSLGIMAGPILGGIILEATDWRWIFLVNLPIGIIGTITAIRFVPNTKPEGGQRFDFAGAAKIAATPLAGIADIDAVVVDAALGLVGAVRDVRMRLARRFALDARKGDPLFHLVPLKSRRGVPDHALSIRTAPGNFPRRSLRCPCAG